MGFRDPWCFNLAMLGKQGWKLLTNLNALVSRIYKSKYFPKGDFLSAAEGSNPSYIWRSIRSTQRLLAKGYRWRLGDGVSAKVWLDPWLKHDTHCWVESQPCEELADLRVCDLLIPGLAAWDEELLEELCVQRDVELIRQMMDPLGGEGDVRIWNYSRTGAYLVRSAYRLCREVLVPDEEHRREGEWRKLWNVPVPHRMRHLLWRIARQVLPTRTSLVRRKVPIPTGCGSCSVGEETLKHLFLECPIAGRCWQLVGLQAAVTNSAQRTDSVAGWVFDMLSRFSADQLADVMAVF
ncbi:Putative ribonuclease H protein At1g65750 [Linum grandiflorum]